MTLYIKYMVCYRCIMMVKEAIKELGLHISEISLGEVEINGEITDEQRELFRCKLLEMRLELMDDKKAILISRIKAVIINMVYHTDEKPHLNFSTHLAEHLGYDYTYLANLYSKTTGATIEHCIILHRIERAKELIIYDELSLNEIALKLHYSSVSHLSRQFKKVTGLTPSFFKSLQYKNRTELDHVCE